jgi:hypothetical protein
MSITANRQVGGGHNTVLQYLSEHFGLYSPKICGRAASGFETLYTS